MNLYSCKYYLRHVLILFQIMNNRVLLQKANSVLKFRYHLRTLYALKETVNCGCSTTYRIADIQRSELEVRHALSREMAAERRRERVARVEDMKYTRLQQQMQVENAINNLDDLFENPHILGMATPDEWYRRLKEGGHNVKPLSGGNFKGVSYEQGGGFKINWGGDRIFQYHPPGRTHHGKDAYYKIGNGVFGLKWYNLDGSPRKK